MNPRFERFLKETAADKKKKESEAKKAEKAALKEAKEKEKAAKKLLKAQEKALKSANKSPGSKSPEPALSWSDDELFSETNLANSPYNKVEDKAVVEETSGLEESETTKTTEVEFTNIQPPSSDEPQKLQEAIKPESTAVEELQENEDPESLFKMFKSEGDYKWLGQDNPATKAAFNLINKSLHPERPLARGVAVLAAKGTSFEDKRLNCLKALANVEAGESKGEVYLKAEPENPYDTNAVAIYDYDTNTMLGYIPKAHEVNKTYAESLTDNKFCGGYIIDGKRSMLKGEENAMILIATGWI